MTVNANVKMGLFANGKEKNQLMIIVHVVSQHQEEREEILIQIFDKIKK
jgi:hypothetical protein